MQERERGVDLLRMAAMWMVAVLHVLNKGGVLAAAELGSPARMAGRLLEDCAYCAVDCFAMISGYVGARRPFRLRGPLGLWIETVFWTLSITAAFALLLPGSVTPGRWIRAVFPVLFRQYWYVTAYFGMCFLIPFFDRSLRGLDRPQGRRLALTLTAVFSLLPTLRQKDVFQTGNGYSVLWLCCLYLLGGCMARWPWKKDWGPRPWALVWLGCSLLAWGTRCLAESIWLRRTGAAWGTVLLTDYTSPTVLLGAAALVCAFSRMQIGPRLGRWIAAASPLSFGVYLIHAHPLIWEHLLSGRFAFLGRAHPLLLAAGTLFAAAGIYLSCSLAEGLRRRLFLALHVPEAAQRLGCAIEERAERFFARE